MDKYQKTLLENDDKEKFYSCTPIKRRGTTLPNKLEDLNLSAGALVALQNNGISTINDLVEFSHGNLRGIRGVNQYVSEIVQKLSSVGISSNGSISSTNSVSSFDYDADYYKLIQDEDIFLTQYLFVLKANPNIETCVYYTNGEWKAAERHGSRFCVMLDFENRVEKIKLTFADNIVDDYTFSVQYVKADKDLYYQKQEAERKANMLQSAQIKHSTGTDLINIYFQPCCSDYEYTEILLYIPQDYVTVGGPYGPVKKPSSWQMFKKCKVPAEDFYKSINGLAYGTYAYVIKQFDKKDNLLLETEYIEFSLKAPKQPIMGRTNII